MIPHTKFLISLSIAAAFLAVCTGARADDLTPSQVARARAKAQCAAFGPGFTAVDGSDTCVWMGAHIRVGLGSRGSDSSNNGWASGSAPVRVNAGDASNDQEDLAPSHLRLPDNDATGSIAR
jgi:hypothetical protein